MAGTIQSALLIPRAQERAKDGNTSRSVWRSDSPPVINHAEMDAGVEALVRELRLSGLVGFDFVLGDRGEAFFLEINARATPSATLSISGSPDLLALLFQTMTASSPGPKRSVNADTIALFPDEMLRDETSPFLSTAYHDIPTDEPGLVEFGLEQVRAKERTHAFVIPSRHKSILLSGRR